MTTVRELIEVDDVKFKDLTVEIIAKKCANDLIRHCGSHIVGLTGNECAPVDAQIVADRWARTPISQESSRACQTSSVLAPTCLTTVSTSDSPAVHTSGASNVKK